MSNTKQDGVVIQLKSIKANLTPYAQGQFVRDLGYAIKAIETQERFSAAKFFLVCLAIELSIKSCILATGSPNKRTHDLDELSKDFSDKVDNTLLTAKDHENLLKAALFYNKDGIYSKGIIYFEANMKEQALSGYKDLPKLNSLIAIKDKLQSSLEANDYFIGL